MIFCLLITNNFGFSLLQEISKFSQNIIICGCLLLQIILWQKYSIAVYIIKNYIFIFGLFNILTLSLSFIFEFSFFQINFCSSIVLKILPTLSFSINLLVMALAVYNNYEEKTESQKHTGLLYENDNLTAIIDKYSSSLQKMRKYYLIFILSFTLSYFVDIYFKFSNVKNENLNLNFITNSTNNRILLNEDFHKSQNLMDGFFLIKNLNNFNYTKNFFFELNNKYDKINKNITERNKTIKNNFTYRILEKISNLTNNNDNTIKYTSACEYYKNLGEKYNFKDLIICFISFVFRDLGPHIYIFVSLFIYKPETLSRSSSFIEI